MNPKLALMPLISSFEATAEIACLAWESQLPDPPGASTILTVNGRLNRERLRNLRDFMIQSEIGGVKDKFLLLEAEGIGGVQAEDVRFEVTRGPLGRRSVFDEFLESLP